jgi:hypothetical protein
MCSSINWAGWFQAVAAFAIVYFTGRSLIVLKGYAEDTKKIAKASAEQVENTQKPFVGLVLKPENIVQRFPGGWVIENQGFGPALNLKHTHGFDPTVFDYTAPVLGKDQFHHLDRINIETARNHEFKIEYESLSGKKYRTSIVWVDGEMRTTFSGPL